MAVVSLMVAEGLARSFRQTWRGTVFRGIAQPFLYFVAFGLGVGTLVDEGQSASLGDPYLTWLAPGLLIASAFQIGANEGGTQVVVGFVWDNTFRIALHTPVSVGQLALGIVHWANFRVLFTTGPMAVLFVALSATGWDEAVLLLLICVVAGSIGASLLAAVGGQLSGATWLSVASRYIVTPLVLLSGSVFPLEELPTGAAMVLRMLPVGAVVDLARGAVGTTGSTSAGLPLAAAWLVASAMALRWSLLDKTRK